MTKLNITNKRIYKLKKHKNQSKKNVPKKRKNKKRGRLGRSFRKRRRKYNIKNNSIKNYKRQKGGVITTIGSRKGKLKDPEKVGSVFKSEELKKKETELKDVQRKIQELGVTYNDVTAPPIKAKRVRFTKNDELVGQLGEAYDDMTQEDKVPNLIKELKQLHNEIGDDDDIKKLSNRQMKALKLKTDIDHTQFEINMITPILREAKKNTNEYKKATDKKVQDVKNQEKAVVKPAELERLQKALTELEGKEDKKKEYEKQKKSFDTKMTNSDKAKREIDKLNQEFNAKWGTWKTDDDTNKNNFIEAHLKGNQMMQGDAKNALTYLEVIQYALKDYEKSSQTWKKTRNDKKLHWKTIEKESKDVSAKITAESVSKKEEYDKGIATETAKKEKLEKEIEALTKKEDEKLSAETDEIAKGLKTGEIKGLEGNIKQQEGVVEKSHEETVKAVKDAEKKKKKADGALFYKDTKRKAADEAQRNVEEKKEQEKKAEESLRAKKHWKKGVEGVGSILHTEIKSSLIVPYVDDNEISRARIIYNERQTDEAKKQKAGEERIPEFQKFLKDSIESFRVLTDQPYIYNPEGPYARTMDHKQLNKMGEKSIKFYNYYLKKAIKSPDGKEKSLVEMISQRMARYINYVMGTDDEKKSHKETIAYLNKKIQELFKPSHSSIPIDKYIGAEETKNFEFRHHFNEKIQALTFLEILLRQTVKSFPQEDSQRYIDLMKTSIDGQPLFNIFCTYLDKCYDTVPGQKLIELETEYGSVDDKLDEIMKKGLDGVTVVNEPCVPPDDGNDDLYMRVSRGIDLYSQETLAAEEKEKQDFLQALKKYEEHAKDTEEMKKEIQGLLPKLQDKTGKIIKEKYFGDSIKEELEKVKRETHGIKVVAEQLKIKNNTEQAAKIEAVKGKLKEEMAKAEENRAKLESEKKEKDKALEEAEKERIRLEEEVKNLTKSRDSCDQTNTEMVKEKQRLLDEAEQKLNEQKALEEAAKEEADTLATSLEEEDQKIATQQAEAEQLDKQEERLKETRKELIESAKREEAADKEAKDEEEEEEDDDEIDLGGIIDEMTPETNVELEFPKGQQEMVIYAAYDPVTKQVKVDHRFLGSQGRIEDVISNYGIGTEAAN